MDIHFTQYQPPKALASGFWQQIGLPARGRKLHELLHQGVEYRVYPKLPKDFRHEIVNFVLRARAENDGKNPAWNSYEKMRTVIEKKMFSNTEDLLPVISFNPKASTEDQKKHSEFVKRMTERGYTEKQVRLLSEWYIRVRKSQ